MAGETDLSLMLASLEPVIVPGEFVVVGGDDAGEAVLVEAAALSAATISETEGTTFVLRRADADRLGLASEYVAAWITLSVHSALDAVGLTAAVSRALADAGISCNMLAGLHHDHLLVPHDRREEAVAILRGLAPRRSDAAVVVPLDGTSEAWRALRPAAALAAGVGGSLAAVCAVDGAAGAAEERRAAIEDRLARFAGIVPSHLHVRDGEPSDVIGEVVAETGASMVCMTTRSRGDLARLVLGSVAETVIRSADIPVVLVGERCRTEPLPGELGPIVLCSDGSAAAASIVPEVAAVAAARGLHTWIVEVVRPDENLIEDEPRENEQVRAALARLQGERERFIEAAEAVDGHVGAVDVSALHGNDVSLAIEHFADDVGAAYVAIGTHGTTGLRRAVLGSVAMQVVRRAPCPVVVVRSRAVS